LGIGNENHPAPICFSELIFAAKRKCLVIPDFQSLPGSGSLTRSAINYQSGAVTPMSGVYSAAIVGMAVVALGPCARFIPKSALVGLLFITYPDFFPHARLRSSMFLLRSSK
jgi:SulP family sulfate permease